MSQFFGQHVKQCGHAFRECCAVGRAPFLALAVLIAHGLWSGEFEEADRQNDNGVILPTAGGEGARAILIDVESGVGDLSGVDPWRPQSLLQVQEPTAVSEQGPRLFVANLLLLGGNCLVLAALLWHRREARFWHMMLHRLANEYNEHNCRLARLWLDHLGDAPQAQGSDEQQEARGDNETGTDPGAGRAAGE